MILISKKHVCICKTFGLFLKAFDLTFALTLLVWRQNYHFFLFINFSLKVFSGMWGECYSSRFLFVVCHLNSPIKVIQKAVTPKHGEEFRHVSYIHKSTTHAHTKLHVDTVPHQNFFFTRIDTNQATQLDTLWQLSKPQPNLNTRLGLTI